MGMVLWLSGVYVEYLSVFELSLICKLLVLLYVEVVGVLLVVLIVWGMVVDIVKVCEGQWMFIYVGVGGVGYFVVQFVVFFGVYVIVMGLMCNLGWLWEFGVVEVIDYLIICFEDVVVDVDVVIDLVGNVVDDIVLCLLSVLWVGGFIVNVFGGSWLIMVEEVDIVGVCVIGFQVVFDGLMLVIIFCLLELGDVKVFVDWVFDFEDVVDVY